MWKEQSWKRSHFENKGEKEKPKFIRQRGEMRPGAGLIQEKMVLDFVTEKQCTFLLQSSGQSSVCKNEDLGHMMSYDTDLEIQDKNSIHHS